MAFWAGSLVLLVLIGLVRKIVIPQLYDAALAAATNQTVKERVRAASMWARKTPFETSLSFSIIADS
ncbi:MAG: hypothetical protein ACLVJN_07260 [Streptococcus parasanguinis]